MTLEEVITFLKERPGYLKEGAGRLSKIVLKGKASIEDCSKALKLIKEDLNRSKRRDEKKNLKVLLYDIETSYNILSSWRVGYNISLPHYSIIKERAIICVSYKWLGKNEVYNLSWDNNQDDRELLKQFIEVMNEADILVAHFGDSFDMKWIKTRALKHNLQMLPKYVTVDTKQLASKHFYFNSNKLDYIAKFLGFEGKIETDYTLWDRIILDKDEEALEEMRIYCDEDVRQLEKVYLRLRNWDKQKQHVGVLYNDDKLSSPITGSKRLELVKTITTSGGTKQRIMKDLDSNVLFEMSDKNYRNYIKEKSHLK